MRDERWIRVMGDEKCDDRKRKIGKGVECGLVRGYMYLYIGIDSEPLLTLGTFSSSSSPWASFFIPLADDVISDNSILEAAKSKTLLTLTLKFLPHTGALQSAARIQ